MNVLDMSDKITDLFPIALISWYKFKRESKILWIENKKEKNEQKNRVVIEYLLKQEQKVDVAIIDEDYNVFFNKNERLVQERELDHYYDYVCINQTLENAQNPTLFLSKVKQFLTENGVLLLVLNNPLGMRYLCGDKDIYTDRSFDGVEAYSRINAFDRQNFDYRMFDQETVRESLENAGFKHIIQYSVLPSLEYPQLIYREDEIPNENLSSRIYPNYNSPNTVFLDEFSTLRVFTANGLFHKVANGYILECCSSELTGNIRQATINLNRGLEYSMNTIIYDDGIVEKSPVFKEGVINLQKVVDNHRDILSRGINIVNPVLVENGIQTPYIKGMGGIDYFKHIAQKGDIDFIWRKIEEFINIIMKSSDHIYESGTGEILLKKGYPDLTLINCIYENDEPVLFDQEYVIENLPAKALINRFVEYIYFDNPNMEQLIQRKTIEEKYGLFENGGRWNTIISDFMYKLKNEDELLPYYEMHCPSVDTINSNRQRMNYSQSEYERLFGQIFSGLDTKKLYLFGSGLFAKRFVELYGRFYKPTAIVDNNSEKWNTDLNGIPIISPKELIANDVNSYKVIICIKNFTVVLKQLKELGVKNISVFDPNGVYDVDRSRPGSSDDNLDVNTSNRGEDTSSKKYNIGYIAGVFDLFHIGHLNLLRRAKEQCNHLIVGVVNDEAVIKNKRVEPFVPFEERIEMVRACKYVDEAVEITYTNAGTKDAFRLYHFDVQFSGSDYVNNGSWLAEKEFLKKNGAELVFFPYTEQTSSSKIKTLIEKHLV